MRTPFPSEHSAQVLDGTWRVAATNENRWLDGTRRDPLITYRVTQSRPLVIEDSVEYDAVPDGGRRSLAGRSKARGTDLVWRGEQVTRRVPRKWSVRGVGAAGAIVVIAFRSNRFVGGGLSVLVRDGADVAGVRSIVAHDALTLGLEPEEFARLTWVMQD